MIPPRVLLVEDDASIRRFVELALEDSGVELVAAATLAAAIEALRSGPYALVLCDLMLPDGSGFDLLHALADHDSPSPAARRVAFSAGVSAQTRRRLANLGVHEVLAKPVSVASLLACVQAAVQPGPAPEAAVDERDADPVDRFFGGDRGLFDAFAAQCRQQWRHDVAAGDRAADGADLPALRRLAHSVKTVLLTLGRPADSALARALEDAATAGRADAAWSLWPRLRERLLASDASAPTP